MRTENASKRHHEWRKVKGNLTTRFGTITAASHFFKCSVDGIRKAVDGKAPLLRARLKAEGLLS